MSDRFDLIVLGGDSRGIAGAIRAARDGARVALLEATLASHPNAAQEVVPMY